MAAGHRQVETRALAVAASVVVHAGLLIVFIQGVRSWPALTERPVMEVQLAPLAPARSRPAPPRRPRKAPRTAATRPAIAPPAARPAPDAREAVEAPPAGVSGGAVQALRDLLGCAHAAFLDLSPEARQRCEDRMTAYRKTTPPIQVDLDPRGLYAVNPIPYLNRKPKNGCKVRAAGAAGPMGQGGAVAGISCGKTF